MKLQNILPYSKQPYSEVGQPSPVRWLTLLETSPGVLEPTGAWWKCRDFLNDLVYVYNGQKAFSIYGWNSETIKVKKGEGAHFLLHEQGKFFDENLTLINKWLKKNKHEEIFFTSEWEGIPKGDVVVKVPHYYWTNTFYMSFITVLIRACTYKQLNTIDDIYNCGESNLTFTGDSRKEVEAAFQHDLKPKMDARVLIDYNKKPLESLDIYTVHNCGFRSWLLCIKALGGVEKL